MTVITESRDLADFCARQVSVDFLAVDTEFLRDNSYWPKLCLAQVAGPAEAVAIDCLAPDIDLAPFLALMADPNVLKVFHSARQDLEIFYHMTGQVPGPIFDTQVAAMVCGFGDSVAYQTLARKLAGARIDKVSRFADWSRRPLTRRQIDYALADVIHLRPCYEALRRSLEKTGRSHWLSEEMTTLSAPETYRLEPETAWRRLKTRSTEPRFLAAVRALAAWREREAQRRDQPRNRVVRDEQLLDIAAHLPGSPEELARTRGLSQDFARGRLGMAILDAVAAALAAPEETWPEPEKRLVLPNGLGPLVDLFKVLLKIKCEKHAVAQKLIASSADLERIAADDRAPVSALSGWRREIFGADALALKHGHVAIGARGGKAVLVSLGDRTDRSADEPSAASPDTQPS